MTKERILARIRGILLEKQQQLQVVLDDLNDGIANDTKSSAGDKYETARSMSQQEIDKVSVQLQEIGRQLALLPGLESVVWNGTIRNGSLVETDGGNFFVGVPAGQVEVEGETVFCLGAAAPIAQVFMGKTAGESCVMNGKKYVIAKVM